ncbi:MAG: ATP-binding protein [Methylococcaceae bacterium]
MSTTLKLPASALKLHVDLTEFVDSKDTHSSNHPPILGQARAQSALAFGVVMPAFGYNVFVMGEAGLGRLTLIANHLDTLSKNSPTPPTYVYVDNFDNARHPRALCLPPGYGQPFCKDIEQLIDTLLANFPAVFESPAYQQKKNVIERQFNQAYDAALDCVEKQAQSQGIALIRESESVAFALIKKKKVLSNEQLSQLPQLERDKFYKQVEILEDGMSEALLELPQYRRTVVEKIRQLDHETIHHVLAPLLADLAEKYGDIEDIVAYLSDITQPLETSIRDHLMLGRGELEGGSVKRQLFSDQFLPNILMDHVLESGAPIVYEPHPIYQNLFGRIEYSNEQGSLLTHYRRICAGSLHKANGGYLILDAEKLLNYPFVWEGLKRALQSGCIEIESPYSDLGVNATITLKPEVIPLNLKVILVGSRDTYYLLEELDNEFNEIFKVLADFDHYIPISPDSLNQFSRLLIRHANDSGFKSLTTSALEGLLEHSCRLAENQHQFSASVRDTLEIIGEASLYASQAEASTIDRIHVDQALSAREYRNGRMSQNILEEMLDGTILIDTDGEAIGKINGLTVLEIGGSCFGAPARITTTVYPGSRGIVDIEREAELGQAIHSKGVMILTGYLGHFYAQQFPLAISASIAIEQSYSPIDGDSAALAELCCLISALTRLPIQQTFAITGSINQYGEVQAIGGVNEKIEGFFRLCKARGLNGQHGVIIPAANKRNLMLKQEVIDAVSAGLFSVYAVASVDEALELLTGQTAGVADPEGNYPEMSINFKAISRLKEISEMAEDDKDESAL